MCVQVHAVQTAQRGYAVQHAYKYALYKQRNMRMPSTRIQVRAVQTAQRAYAVNARTSTRAYSNVFHRWLHMVIQF
jgi:hypothetical protein